MRRTARPSFEKLGKKRRGGSGEMPLRVDVHNGLQCSSTGVEKRGKGSQPLELDTLGGQLGKGEGPRVNFFLFRPRESKSPSGQFLTATLPSGSLKLG